MLTSERVLIYRPDHVLDIPYAFIKSIRIDPSHRNTRDIFLEGVPNAKKESSVISFLKNRQ